ncbi:hypothetical protein [Streptomyces sp. NPDC007063]|uniref:hypothetical protein n=1 Tax=Streptomyces sp. NPDC007063 TaxID=3364772 RepID=UPI0036A6CFC8
MLDSDEFFLTMPGYEHCEAGKPGASLQTLDTVCYAAAASDTDRCSKAAGLI